MHASRRATIAAIALVVVIAAALFYLVFLGNQVTTPLPPVSP
jgi:hypothetical protein